MPDMVPEYLCRGCERDVDEDGNSQRECAAGRYGTDDHHCCDGSC